MYCPLCGNKLVESTKENEPGDYSTRYGCEKGCFNAEDFPIVYHGALTGIDSEPGDSWSLTWLK